jgi:hypothetical protein
MLLAFVMALMLCRTMDWQNEPTGIQAADHCSPPNESLPVMSHHDGILCAA